MTDSKQRVTLGSVSEAETQKQAQVTEAVRLLFDPNQVKRGLALLLDLYDGVDPRAIVQRAIFDARIYMAIQANCNSENLADDTVIIITNLIDYNASLQAESEAD